jgi:hypothetical protein
LLTAFTFENRDDGGIFPDLRDLSGLPNNIEEFA